MADLVFSIHPLDLANALFNAVEVSKDAGGRPGCPNVLIRYQPDEDYHSGLVVVYGIGRIVGGRTTLVLDTKAPEGEASVCITRERADQLQSMLRQVKGGKAARVSVRIIEEGIETVDFNEDGEPEVDIHNVIVSKGEGEPMAELMDSDPEREWTRHFLLIDTILDSTRGPLEGPVAFSLEGMDRITALKGLGTKILDLAGTNREKVVAVAAGPTFRGIVGTIDRSIYTDEEHEGFLLSSSGAAKSTAQTTASLESAD